MKTLEIRTIISPINEHDPKAMRVVYPDGKVDFNDFQENLKKQINAQQTSIQGKK
jgi:hypothetical protein